MTDVAQLFIDKSRSLLTHDYVPKINQCLDQLTEQDIWWRPNEASNSIGNLILHLCGNVTMWIIGGVGSLRFERNRQAEFDARGPLPAAELRTRMNETVRRADEVLNGIGEDQLRERREIQGYDVTVLEAIYHVVEHFGMHTGQIILLSKARVDRDLNLWTAPDP